MKRFKSSFLLVRCALAALFMLAACGEASCPAGAIAEGDRCVPAPSCEEGEILAGSTCVATDGGDPDGGGDGDGDGEVSDPDSSVEEQAPGDGDGGGDGDGDGDGDEPCAGLDCGDDGACQVVEGQAVCVCDEGFTGEQCDQCEQGLAREGDACLPLCDVANAPDCGSHGSCVADETEASCECERGYAGALCSECAEGFVREGEACIPCGECGEHSACDDEAEIPVCLCVAGYAQEVAGCVWSGDGSTGGIKDGGLDNAADWVTKHVTVSSGLADFDNAGEGSTCELGFLEQTLTMPDRDDAEPLLMEIDVLAPCTNAEAESCPPLLVEIGETMRRFAVAGGASPTMRKLSLCLGESGYGGEVPFRIRPGMANQYGRAAVSCEDAVWPLVTAVEIRSATLSECPADGATQGTLASANGWHLSQASIANTTLDLDTAGATASTRLAVPKDSDLAVRVTGGPTYVTIDGMWWQFNVTGAAEYCLPSWTHGAVIDIGFYSYFTSSSITAFSVVSNEACEDASFDRGFERGNRTGSWSTEPMAAVVDFDGSRVWRTTSGTATQRTEGLVQFPLIAEGEAVAFTSAHRVNVPLTEGRYSFDIDGPVTVEVTSTAWTTHIECLPPAWVGQPRFVQINASATGNPPPYLYIDDVGPEALDANYCP